MCEGKRYAIYLKKMKFNEENKRKKQHIGRRTGIDVKAGKRIRKYEDGTENFDDYWTDSDASRKESKLSLISPDEDNSCLDGVVPLKTSLAPSKTVLVCEEKNNVNEEYVKLILGNKNTSKQEEQLGGNNHIPVAHSPRLQHENLIVDLNSCDERKFSASKDYLINTLSDITLKNLHFANNSEHEDCHLSDTYFRISLTNKSKRYRKEEPDKSLHNIKTQSKEIKIKSNLDCFIFDLKGDNKLLETNKSFVSNNYCKDNESHASSPKSIDTTIHKENFQDALKEKSKNKLIKGNKQKIPVNKTQELKKNSKLILPLCEKEKGFSVHLNQAEETSEVFNETEPLISVTSDDVQKIQQKRVYTKRNVAKNIQRKIHMTRAQIKTIKNSQQTSSESSSQNLHDGELKETSEETTKCVIPLIKLQDAEEVDQSCSPPKKQKTGCVTTKPNIEEEEDLRSKQRIILKNENNVKSLPERSNNDSLSINIPDEEGFHISLINKRSAWQNSIKQNKTSQKNIAFDEKAITENKLYCSSEIKTSCAANITTIEHTHDILQSSHSVVLSSHVQNENKLVKGKQRLTGQRSKVSKQKNSQKYKSRNTVKTCNPAVKSHDKKQKQDGTEHISEKNKEADLSKMTRNVNKKSVQKIKCMSNNSQSHDDFQVEEGNHNDTLKRENIKTLTEDSVPGLRRSCRTRVQPLEYWRNERICYKFVHGEYQIVNIDPGFKYEVIKKPQQCQRPCRETLKKSYRTKPPLINDLCSANNKSEIHCLPLNGGIILSEKKEMSADIIRSHQSLTWKGPTGTPASPSDAVIVSKGYCLKDVGTGILKIRPHREKHLQYIPDYDVIFFVVRGKIEVQVYETVWHLESCDTFIVPRGNAYRIKNLEKVEAIVSFTSLKKEILQELLL